MNETIIKFLKEKNKRNVFSYAYKSSSGNDILHLEFLNIDDVPTEDIIKSGVLIYNNDNELIQGDFSKFVTIYSSKDNVFELSVSEVYTEPDTSMDVENNYSEEQLLEIEKDKKRNEITSNITALKNQLDSTDYRIIKTYEYYLVDKSSEYDIKALHDEREKIRNDINSLEEELETLN